jgi:hypothetical protein
MEALEVAIAAARKMVFAFAHVEAEAKSNDLVKKNEPKAKCVETQAVSKGIGIKKEAMAKGVKIKKEFVDES